MRTPCCHTFLAFILKFLNFLQAFIGVAIIIYSAYMLDQWHRHHDGVNPRNFASEVDIFNYNVVGLDFQSLPAPWFIYAFMGVGIFIFCITCVGHFAAEAINGCCLCFYALLTTVFVLLEVSLVTYIAFDHQWEKVTFIDILVFCFFFFLFLCHCLFQDLPYDPTGELDSLRTFIEGNADILEWVGIAIVVMQVLSLLFAIILRSLVSSQRVDEDDIEGDFDFRSRTREPLLHSYSGHISGSPKGDSDIWSSRMREKYGLNSGDGKHNLLNQNSETETTKM